jgi:hypothetical protein
MGTDITVSLEGIDLSSLRKLDVVNPSEAFRASRRAFRPKVHRAKMISRGCAGIPSTGGRMYWASALFTRMIGISSSILKLIPHDEKKDHWDAASICALTRNLAECYLWLFFLSFDDVSDEEHEARIYLMYAHDNRGRERIAEESVADSQIAEYYRRVRAEIAQKLTQNSFFETLPEKRRNELIRGDKTPFVQDDLLERMGIERSEFRALYRVLSAQTHSSPVAFYDVLTIGGGTGTVHEHEMRYMGLALQFAVQLLDWAEANMVSMHPYAERRGKLLSEKDVRNGKHLGFPIPD